MNFIMNKPVLATFIIFLIFQLITSSERDTLKRIDLKIDLLTIVFIVIIISFKKKGLL